MVATINGTYSVEVVPMDSSSPSHDQWQQKLRNCHKLEEFNGIDDENLFSHVSKTDEKLQELVREFFLREIELCVFGKGSNNNEAFACWKFIQQEDLLPDNISVICDEYAKAKKQYESKLKEIQKAYDTARTSVTQSNRGATATNEKISVELNNQLVLRVQQLKEASLKLEDLNECIRQRRVASNKLIRLVGAEEYVEINNLPALESHSKTNSILIKSLQKMEVKIDAGVKQLEQKVNAATKINDKIRFASSDFQSTLEDKRQELVAVRKKIEEYTQDRLKLISAVEQLTVSSMNTLQDERDEEEEKLRSMLPDLMGVLEKQKQLVLAANRALANHKSKRAEHTDKHNVIIKKLSEKNKNDKDDASLSIKALELSIKFRLQQGTELW